MTPITLRVIDGSDRGKVYDDLPVPITIGREEGNSIQLNDDRISRFHLKIQRDHDDIVLTDLGSTNGSKVNNEEVQLRILRHGDLITLGRSTILFGNRKQISERMEKLAPSSAGHMEREAGSSNHDLSDSSSEALNLKGKLKEDPQYQLSLLELDPPKLPERLSPGQAAKLAEMVEFLHLQIRSIISNAEFDRSSNCVQLTAKQWQKVVSTQAWLSEYLRNIGQPD
jgi:pSer/pThr/pTyr-binding forkhead associated (FHA) protein